MPGELVNDRVNELYRGEIFAPETQRACRDRIHWICSQVTGDQVLDVGCSQGITVLLLGRDGLHVMGVDVDAEAINYANGELQKEPEYVQQNVKFVQVGADGLPFPDESFDTVVLGELIEHLTQPERMLAEVRRLIRPEGRIVITTPFGLHPHPAHVQTFYLSNFLAIVEGHFAIHSLRIVDGYINCVGTKRSPEQEQESHILLPEKLLAVAEAAFLVKEQRYYEHRERVSEQNKSLRQDLTKTRSELAGLKETAREAQQRLQKLERETGQLNAACLSSVEHIRDFLHARGVNPEVAFLADRVQRALAKLQQGQSAQTSLEVLTDLVMESVQVFQVRLEQIDQEVGERNEACLASMRRIRNLLRTFDESQGINQLADRIERTLAAPGDEQSVEASLDCLVDLVAESVRFFDARLRQIEDEYKDRLRQDLEAQRKTYEDRMNRLSEDLKALEIQRGDLKELEKRIDGLAREHRSALEEIARNQVPSVVIPDERTAQLFGEYRRMIDRLQERLAGSLDQLTTKQNDLTDRLSAHQGRLEDITVERDRLLERVEEARHKLQGLSASCERLRDQLTQEKTRSQDRQGRFERSRNDVAAARRKLQSLSGACDRLREQLLREKKRSQALQAKCAVRAAQIEDLRTSVRWRVGDLFVEASQSPLSVFKVPAHLVRLYREGRQRRKTRQETPGVVDGNLPTPVAAPSEPASPDPGREPKVVAEAPAAAPLIDDTNGGVVPRREMNVACILDEFSLTCFRPEARLWELTPADWRAQMEAARPAFLFVESAWRGRDELWRHLVTCSRRDGDGPLRDIVDYCHEHNIPTVFWNKEDPANFEHFVDTAAWFNVVFTTDSDCLDQYREATGHDRCFALPFAAQERVHHPVGRRGGEFGNIAFAGTWYSQKHDGRREDAEMILRPALDFGLHIYDRMHTFTGPGWQNYQWPEEYHAAIRGGLAYSEMLEAYRKYHVFLNVNSVRKSPTMCARRVFEILACGTNVVSAYTPAIENLIGSDCAFLSRAASETRNHLERLLSDEVMRNRTSVRAIRRIMASHTYVHRFARILEAVGQPEEVAEPVLLCLMTVRSREELAAARRFADAQTYTTLRWAWLVADDTLKADCPGLASMFSTEAEWATGVERALAENRADLVMRWTPATPPGGEWVEDLALAFRYFDGDGAGKPLDEPADKLVFRSAERLPLATTVLRTSAAAKLGAGAMWSEEAFAAACPKQELRLLATDTVGISQSRSGDRPA